jgi:4-aminobutyrate aminotransferase/(S)-3-amino-2-methylpropionate transaminase
MTTVKAESYASAAARERHVPRGLANTHPIFIDRAEGTRVWDVDGKEYLDFTSGIGVLNTGHRHPRIVSAVQEQLGRLMHTCFQVTMYEPYVELVSRLCALAGEVNTHKGVLFTTGAEAIENAVKIARAHTRRTAVIAFSGGFHGRSLLALTMTASSPAYRQNFGPFAADVYHTPFPDEYRGWTTEAAIDALQQLFGTEVMPEHVAAIVIEPELGEGGFVPARDHRTARHRARRRRSAERFRADREDVRLPARRHPTRSRGDGQEPRGGPAALGRRGQGRDHGRASSRRSRRHVRR